MADIKSNYKVVWKKILVNPLYLSLVGLIFAESIFALIYIFRPAESSISTIGFYITGIVGLGVGIPISLSQKKMYRLLDSAYQELEEKNQLLMVESDFKQKLVSIIGHDVRSPLSGIQGVLDLLKSELVDSEEFRKLLLELNTEVEFTMETLDRLMYWAKNRLAGAPMGSVYGLDNLEAKAKNYFTRSSRGKNIQLEWKAFDNDVLFFGDADSVSIAISNILHNSLKFAPENSTIKVWGERKSSGDYHLIIQDQGPGFKGVNPFDKANWLNQKGADSKKGAGIGLVLIREIINMCGCDLKAEDAPEGGARFIIKLKVNQKV